MDVNNYVEFVAEQLVNELSPVSKIKQVTENTVLLGAYAECAVRNLVRRYVTPMRVSTGAVLDFPLPDKLNQIDLIIWAPFPASALFDVENFGLVPRSSVFGVIEMKRSNYSDVETRMEEFFELTSQNKIVADPITQISTPGNGGLGVFGILEKGPSKKLVELIGQKKVIAIFEKDNEKVSVRTDDVLTLVNYLHLILRSYQIQSADSGRVFQLISASG